MSHPSRHRRRRPNVDTYVHRSGRTGRAGRAGVAVTLYADNEVNDVRRIEQGVGQGFKFERGAVPSAEQVMSLAGTVAREQIKGVSEEMVGYFTESAQELLAEEGSEVSGRSALRFFFLRFSGWAPVPGGTRAVLGS